MGFWRRLFLLLLCWPGAGEVRGSVERAVWRYELLDGSWLEDECEVCGRPGIRVPVRGTFDLRLVESNPLEARYAVENLEVRSVGGGYVIRASGSYVQGGEVAVTQRMEVAAEVTAAGRLVAADFRSGVVVPGKLWPMISVLLRQSNGTALQAFRLSVDAAPLRELWFSTALGFTPSGGVPASVSGGDLLSVSGHVVRTAGSLCAVLGPMPPCSDLGLDAVGLRPGGEMLFSVGQDVFSERLGLLQAGDLLSDRGQVVRRNRDLLAAFAVDRPEADAGLDAFALTGDGEMLFSVTSPVFSKALGRMLGTGDLLSADGRIFRPAADLLGRFRPDKPGDPGVDALHVWSSGEIWFSTERGFQDTLLGSVFPGDLLSDTGTVVFRGGDLTARFAPVEDVADFGLDGLVVISDAAVLPPEPVLRLKLGESGRGVVLSWDGGGMVFQVERAGADGLFAPVGPLQTAGEWVDPDGPAVLPRASYRLRQW